MQTEFLFLLNFIILSATFFVADLIFSKTKHIQKSTEEMDSLLEHVARCIRRSSS